MPASILQYNNNYAQEDVAFPGLATSYTSNVSTGTLLVDFSSQRYGDINFFLNVFDSQANTWTQIANTLGSPANVCNSSVAFTNGQHAAADTVTYPLYGVVDSYNVENNVWELSGVNALDSTALSYAGGTGITSPISGSLTTVDGKVFNFSTTGTYTNWFLTLVAFRGVVGSTVSLYVMAFCTIGQAAGVGGGVQESVSGWTFLHTDASQPGAGGGGYNGIYAQTLTYQLETNFQYPNGNPVANGYLLISLDRDCQGPSNVQISAGRVTRVALDSNGNAAGFLPFVNSSLFPSDSSYIIEVYSPTGQLVRGPYNAVQN